MFVLAFCQSLLSKVCCDMHMNLCGNMEAPCLEIDWNYEIYVSSPVLARMVKLPCWASHFARWAEQVLGIRWPLQVVEKVISAKSRSWQRRYKRFTKASSEPDRITCFWIYSYRADSVTITLSILWKTDLIVASWVLKSGLGDLYSRIRVLISISFAPERRFLTVTSASKAKIDV